MHISSTRCTQKIGKLTVDVGVNPAINFINIGSKLLRIEVKGSFIGGKKVVKG